MRFEEFEIVCKAQLTCDPFGDASRPKQLVLRIVEFLVEPAVGLFKPLDIGDALVLAADLDPRRGGILRGRHHRQDQTGEKRQCQDRENNPFAPLDDAEIFAHQRCFIYGRAVGTAAVVVYREDGVVALLTGVDQGRA